MDLKENEVNKMYELEKLGPRNEVEAEIAEDRKFSSAERLSCQMDPLDGLVLQIPESTSS